MKRRFTVDASKKIKASIAPYKRSIENLISEDNLDERFAYDLPEEFTLNLLGFEVKAYTVDSEVVLLQSFDPWAPDDNGLGEPPTGVKYTVLVPIFESDMDGSTSFDNLMGVVNKDIHRFLEGEIWGSDYGGYVLNISNNEGDYRHFLPILEEKLAGSQDIDTMVGCYVATICIFPFG